jgi:predicted N-acyltransferase
MADFPSESAPDEKPSNSKPLGRLRRVIGDAKAAKQPSGFEFALADRLDFLNGEHWGKLAANGSVFLSREYLSALREAGPHDLMLRAGIVYRDGVPVACFATQTFELDGTQLVGSVEQLSDEDKAQLAIKKLTRKALGAVHRRVMVCGNVISWGPHGVAIRDGEDSEEIWTAIAEALYRLRRGDKLHGQTDYVMIKDLPKSLSDQADVLSRFGYRAVETEPDMVLAISQEWSSLDDYLADLNKKYRKSARGVLKSIDEAGVSVSPVADVDAVSARLHELYRNVAERADVRLARIPAEFFPTVARSLGPDRFATIGASLDEEIIGFVTVVRDGETAVGYFLGVDYEKNADLPVYHRLLFAVIEQAIEWKCRRVSFGRTALDAKARLGCTPEPTFVWIRHRVPVLNIAVKQLLRAVPHAEPPERNPFKNQPGS